MDSRIAESAAKPKVRPWMEALSKRCMELMLHHTRCVGTGRLSGVTEKSLITIIAAHAPLDAVPAPSLEVATAPKHDYAKCGTFDVFGVSNCPKCAIQIQWIKEARTPQEAVPAPQPPSEDVAKLVEATRKVDEAKYYRSGGGE